jgi:iron(III) transport system permease protein
VKQNIPFRRDPCCPGAAGRVTVSVYSAAGDFSPFSAGSLGDAFGGVSALLADPQLPAMLGGTLWIACGVALMSVFGLPLGMLRGMFSLPLPRLWDLLFLIPF